MRSVAFIGLILLVACGNPNAPQPPLNYHDPEILFHFWYHQGEIPGAYPDTAIMRWYNGTPSQPDSAKLLAQVQITGTDTLCAYFLVVSGTPMYFDVGWKRHGITTLGIFTVGPFNPKDPNDYDPYWDISVSEDTLAGATGAQGYSSRTKSFCPKTIARDSITAAALP